MTFSHFPIPFPYAHRFIYLITSPQKYSLRGFFSGVVKEVTPLRISETALEWGLFLFSYPQGVYIIFFIYGTSVIIIPAGLQDISTILSLRRNKHHLKPLDAESIQKHIEEFVFAVLDGEKVGIMRLFESPSCPQVIEMGSFVKTHTISAGHGICTALIHYAEQEAAKIRKTVIALTEPIGIDETGLARHLQRCGWELGVHPQYESRKQESPQKVLWQKLPQRLDPDSEHSYI